MNSVRAVWRLARGVLHVFRGVLICAVVFPRIDEAAQMVHVQRWSARMLELLGIGIDARGTPSPGPVLIVSNHVSWLDIVAINAVRPVRFVAKADMRRWPLLGWMVAAGGTLFIEREKKRDALRVVHHIADALSGGGRMAVFPEGTTGDGHGRLPFHANLLQAAISIGATVQPVALRYSDASARISAAAAYVGEMSLARSVWDIVHARGVVAHVAHLEPVPATGQDRRVLARRMRAAIDAALMHPF